MTERLANTGTSVLSISIVTWRLDGSLFAQVLDHLRKAIRLFEQQDSVPVQISIIDNGNDLSLIRELLQARGLTAQTAVISTGQNLGYGKAHNIAIAATASRFHLIMNPDVLVAEDALVNAVKFLEGHRDVAAVSPYATDGLGNTAFLCKRYPAVFDLALRGFAPRTLRNLFSKRLDQYEGRSLAKSETAARVDLISGCFMFCRTDALKKAGGFNDSYFLYFEDFSLSLELAKFGQLMYVPACRIVHYGGHAGKKGLRHIGHFMSSAFKFYNHYGWKLF